MLLDSEPRDREWLTRPFCGKVIGIFLGMKGAIRGPPRRKQYETVQNAWTNKFEMLQISIDFLMFLEGLDAVGKLRLFQTLVRPLPAGCRLTCAWIFQDQVFRVQFSLTEEDEPGF